MFDIEMSFFDIKTIKNYKIVVLKAWDYAQMIFSKRKASDFICQSRNRYQKVQNIDVSLPVGTFF